MTPCRWSANPVKPIGKPTIWSARPCSCQHTRTITQERRNACLNALCTVRTITACSGSDSSKRPTPCESLTCTHVLNNSRRSLQKCRAPLVATTSYKDVEQSHQEVDEELGVIRPAMLNDQAVDLRSDRLPCTPQPWLKPPCRPCQVGGHSPHNQLPAT